MPYKVLLIDDEPIIVRGLKKLIKWNAMDTEIIGEFFEGSQAEQFILDKKPDIVVSDINMPGKSGIDLLKIIKEKNLSTKVVFLSGYQDFSYARDAVTFGAIDYILKPINKVQLQDAIHKAINLLNKEKEEVQVRQKLSGYETESKSLSFERFLDGMVLGYDDAGSSIDSFASYGIDDNDDYFTALNLEIDELGEKASQLSAQEVQLIKFAVFNIFEQLIKSKDAGIVFYKRNNILGIIHGKNPEECEKLSCDIASQAVDLVKSSLGKSITIGLGKLVHGMGLIPKSYSDSNTALQTKYFLGGNKVLNIRDINRDGYRIEDLHEFQKLISKCVISNEKEKTFEKVNELMDIILGISYGNKDSALSYLLATIAFIKKQLIDTGFPVVNFHTQDDGYLNEIQTLGSWDDVKSWINDFIDRVFKTISASIKNREVVDITKVKDYIEANYDKNITLDTVASIACMNAYYFSSFFKKHTGENFKDFLTKIRMEKALKILMTSDCKVYEIAEKVGFNDSRHFSDMFRKYYGSNPADYKNKLKGLNNT